MPGRDPHVDALAAGLKITPPMHAEVESVDLVPGRAQEGNENGSEVAMIVRNEDIHRLPFGLCNQLHGAARRPPSTHEP
jgi:hypothetical protein